MVELSTKAKVKKSFLTLDFFVGGDSTNRSDNVEALLVVGDSGESTGWGLNAGLEPLTTEANKSLLAWMEDEVGL